MRHTAITAALLALVVVAPRVSAAQQLPLPASPRAAATATAAQATPPVSSGALDNTIDAGEAENPTPVRRLISWNEYDAKLFSIRVGGGILYDYASYAQDDNSRSQFDLESQTKLRDARVLFKGKLKFKRPTTWSAGIMYDAANGKWLFRQTGVMIDVPEIWGSIFVGRSKEGVSLNKVMVGYAGWTMERAPISDATLPILADGVKWLGYLPKRHLVWNLGVYGDAFSEGQTFSSYGNQVAGRAAWVPVMSESGGTLLHIGISERYGKPNNGKLKLRARPEAWPAPYFVDTGDFATDITAMTAIEIYYRPGRYTMGSEYFFLRADAPASNNPMFHGGQVFGTWLITGETRSYNTRGGYFNQVSPKHDVFHGGPGAWELVTQYSYTDFDAGTLTGGKFWRLTPMLNWYLSDNVRFELAYGYGSLDRFGVVGKTQFFQARIQIQL
jgi:phosphate-selective porin OprO/OprP